MSNCIFTIGSVTQSMKAIRALNAYSVPAQTVKLGSGNGRSGCIYGIEFSCKYADNIKRILSAENIRYEALAK